MMMGSTSNFVLYPAFCLSQFNNLIELNNVELSIFQIQIEYILFHVFRIFYIRFCFLNVDGEILQF